MRQRSGTTAQWAANNPILARGELATEYGPGEVFVGAKFGDGHTPWLELPYLGSDSNADVGIGDIPGLADALAAAVRKTGNETITGTKTFTTPPVVPDAAAPGQPVNKGQLDGINATTVHKFGAETVDGIKTFTEPPVVPNAVSSGQAVNKGQLDAGGTNTVKKTGAETIGGVKTFTNSPIVPTATGSDQAVNKGQLDAGLAGVGGSGPAPVSTSALVDFGVQQAELAMGSTFGNGYGTTVVDGILQGIREIGGKRVRIAVWWQAWETTKGVYGGPSNWANLDYVLNKCAALGIIPLLCITAPVPVSYSPTIADFANFCTAIAGRYGASGTGQVTDWEVWNEANIVGQNVPGAFTVANYTAWLIAGSVALKAASSTAFIIAGGTGAGTTSANQIDPVDWVTGLYANGAKPYIDAVGYHWYTTDGLLGTIQEPSDTQIFYTKMLQVRNVMVSNGDSAKSVWMTEFGVPVPQVSAQVAAHYTAIQINLMARLSWLKTIIVLGYQQAAGNPEYGLVDVSFAKIQPMWDTVHNINSVVEEVARNSVAVEHVSASGARDGTKFLRDDWTWAAPAGGGGGGSSGTSLITGKQLRDSRYGDRVHPAANSSGPIVTNNAMTTTAPSLTGMIFVPWSKVDETGRSVFNRQGQNWVAAPSNWGPSQSGCLNNTTDRSGGYIGGNTMSPGGMEVHFVTQSKRIVLQYQIVGAFTNSGIYDATYLVEGNGQMARLQELPEQINSTTGAAPYYKEIATFGSRRTREHRYLMPGQTLLHGVWIEQGCDLYAGPNYPLFAFDGDSWLEALSAGTWINGRGTDEVYGSFYTTTPGWWMVIMSGFKGIWNGQGSTGLDNPGVGNGSSRFLSVARNTFFASKFAAQKPLAYCLFGTANDGYHNGGVGVPFATYRDMLLSGIADLRTRVGDTAMPVILNGPQSLSDPLTQFPAGPQAVHRAACIAAVAAGTNMQYFDQIDYTYGNFGDQNGSPATSSWAQLNGDLLHPNISGGKYIGHRYIDDISSLVFPSDRVAATMAWKG